MRLLHGHWSRKSQWECLSGMDPVAELLCCDMSFTLTPYDGSFCTCIESYIIHLHWHCLAMPPRSCSSFLVPLCGHSSSHTSAASARRVA